MNATTNDVFLLTLEGFRAYQAGMNSMAVECFRRAAESAEEQHQTRQMIHCLRWTGNALLWAGRHDESFPYLLRAVSYHADPLADIEDVYGAMTDLGLLCVRSRPYALLQKMLADTRQFLAQRGLERWGHRVDLLQAMGHLRRGEFSEAHQLASRAWQRVRTGVDGPCYQNGAYLNILFRAAHGLADTALMDAALAEFSAHGERRIVMSQLRHKIAQAMRLAFDGVSDANRDLIRFLVEELMGTLTATEFVREESLEAVRLLALIGRHQQAQEILDSAGFVESADTALVRLDIELCLLAQKAGWHPPLYISHPSSQNFVPPMSMHDEERRSKVEALLNDALSQALIEDARLDGKLNSERVTRRKQWIEGGLAVHLAESSFRRGE